MNLILNNNNTNISEMEGFDTIVIDTKKTIPTIKTIYPEINPLTKEGTTSCITYERKKYIKHISYQKLLTPKSGIDINFYITDTKEITNGYIDFYTIKKSTTKRNGHYRIEFNDGYFQVYAHLSRKYDYKYPIGGYKVDGKLTPEKLTIIISRMLEIILKHAEKKKKWVIITTQPNFSSIECLIYLEACLLEQISDIINNKYLSFEEQNILNNFYKRYTNKRNKENIRVREKEI